MSSFNQTFNLISRAPRAHLFRRTVAVRSISNSARHHAAEKPTFGAFPSPPRLPKEEQELFEQLQQSSTGAFSTPRRPPPQINQSPDSTPADAETANSNNVSDSAVGFKAKEIKVEGVGEELHANVRRGAPPEFEGERNPKTGEVGGPKNEPLRWGAEGEWSYNGRVTDF